MNLWQLGLTVLAGIIVVAALWGWLEKRRSRQPCQCMDCRIRFYQHHYSLGRNPNWPLESDGVDFPEWVNDRDWDLAAKLELYEADQ